MQHFYVGGLEKISMNDLLALHDHTSCQISMVRILTCLSQWITHLAFGVGECSCSQ